MKLQDNLGNEVEIKETDETQAPDLLQSVRTKAGGALASQVAGERLVLRCKARATAAEYRSFMDVLKSGAIRYYYTPEETYSFYSSVSIPFPCVISNLQSSWDNRAVYYITFTVTSVEYV
jgi:hypothetical protein